MERMMKLQDVILKAMAKKITWLEAAEIIGVCDRTMRRMRERYEEFGYDGLFDQRRRKRTTLRVPMAAAEAAKKSNASLRMSGESISYTKKRDLPTSPRLWKYLL